MVARQGRLLYTSPIRVQIFLTKVIIIFANGISTRGSSNKEETEEEKRGDILRVSVLEERISACLLERISNTLVCESAVCMRKRENV